MIKGSVVPAFLDPGEWSACFGESFLHMLLADITGNGRHFKAGSYLREMAGTGGIPDARNTVAEAFLKHTKGEWLFTVDTDMGFAPDTVERLLAAADRKERPVVGALCFAQRRMGRTKLRGERYGIVPTLYGWVETDTESGFAPMPSWDRGHVIPVGATGAACMLIHRSVLEKVHAKYGTWYDPITHPTANPNGKPRTFSEDLSFCIRVAGCDMSIHVDTSTKTTHHKGGIYLDEEAYDRQGIERGLGALSEEEVNRADDLARAAV